MVPRKGAAAAADGPTRIDVPALHVVDQPTVGWSSDRVTVGASPVSATCRAPNGAADAPTFQITTTPNPKQKRALELIGLIKL